MYKQVIAIYMHACRLTTDNYKLRELTINSLASHTLSAKGVACETYTYISVFTFLCTTVSHYYRETCFKLATCADFRISNSGDYQLPDW